MQMVQQELMSTYHIPLTKIQTGGLRITTTFSPSMMQGADQGGQHREAAAGRRRWGVALPYYDHFGISLENPKNGAIIAIYGGPGYGAPNCLRLYCDYNMAEAPHPVGSSMKPYVLAAAINQGMDVQNSVLNGFSPLWIPPEYNAQYKAMLSQCAGHRRAVPLQPSRSAGGSRWATQALARSRSPRPPRSRPTRPSPTWRTTSA